MADRVVRMQDWMIKLERAKALLDAGALTLQEFEAEKARLLPSSTSIDDHFNPSEIEDDDPYIEDEPASRSRSLKFAPAALLLMGIATTGYLLFRDGPEQAQPAQTHVAAPQSAEFPLDVATPTPPGTTPVEAIVQKQSVPESGFSCVGPYSNVSFSEESGDGSGLFVRIGNEGLITWKYFEGSIASAQVEITERYDNVVSASVQYINDPDQPPSLVKLRCDGGRVIVSGDNMDLLSLEKLTASQAAELDN